MGRCRGPVSTGQEAPAGTSLWTEGPGRDAARSPDPPGKADESFKSGSLSDVWEPRPQRAAGGAWSAHSSRLSLASFSAPATGSGGHFPSGRTVRVSTST